MSEAIKYPHTTSHYKRWIADSKDSFTKIHSVLSQRAIEKFFNSIQHADRFEDLKKYIEQKVTVKMQQNAFTWIIRTSLDIWQIKLIDFRVCNTALTLFKRFFLRKFILDVVPQILINTCLLVAIKIENSIPEMRPVEAFFSNNETEKFLQSVQIESELLHYTMYDFSVVHGDSILQYYNNKYYIYRLNSNDFSTPSNWNKSKSIRLKYEFCHYEVQHKNKPHGNELLDSQTKHLYMQELELWLQYSLYQTQSLYLLTHISNIHFYYTPALISAAIFVFYYEDVCKFNDVNDFIRTTIPPDISSNNSKTNQIFKSISDLKHEIALLHHQLSTTTNEMLKSDIITLNKLLKRIGKFTALKRNADTINNTAAKKIKIDIANTEASIDLGYDI